MSLAGRRILLTGATGGIGRHVAQGLADRGAVVLLADRPGEALEALVATINDAGGRGHALGVDLLDPEAPEQLALDAISFAGGVDVLVNLAGLMSFSLFHNEDAAHAERLWRVNVLAPVRLTRALLPQMISRGEGRIVNVGSMFGSIGSACFASYSASKFALRGFSQALRRELDGTGVGVSYVSPRYTRTAINAGAIARMAHALRLNQDEPETVAERIVHAVVTGPAELYVGFPESFFARVNALWPGLVDGAVRRQDARVREFAKSP